MAELLILKAYREERLILCTREIQNTIKDSVHKLLSDTIDRLGLSAFFQIQRDHIIGRNGSRFIFKGLRHSVAEIKSTEGLTDCWVEEAQSVSNESWDVLIPTVRQEGSQFYITFNPDDPHDPTLERFVNTKRDDALLININYNDNPFFPEVLRKEMEYDKKNDYEKYLWVWEGQPRSISDAQVFKGKFRVDNFELPVDDEGNCLIDEFYFGADFGFAVDPSTLNRCFIYGRKLYIDYEAYGVGVELEEIPQLYRSVPLSNKYNIKADNSRPETISFLRSKGWNISGLNKLSIEDGIEFLRSFDEIVIHERCKHTAEEFKLYSYKVDKKTGEILPVIVDKNNHCIDGIRYSLYHLIKGDFKFAYIGADGEMSDYPNSNSEVHEYDFGESPLDINDNEPDMWGDEW